MVSQKTRLIHSKSLKEFLQEECGLEPIEEVDNPFREGFKSWKFTVNKQFNEAMDEWYSLEVEFEEICSFISTEANEGRLYVIIDKSQGQRDKDCNYRIHRNTRKIFKVKIRK